MQLRSFHQRLLILMLALALAFPVFGVSSTHAAVGDNCINQDNFPDSNLCNVVAGERCGEDGTCIFSNLSEGGSGLSIPTGQVIISDAIVQDRTFGALIVDIVNYFIGFLGLVATVMFIYSGVLWVVNAGNEEMITKAKKIMTYAVMGILIIMLSYTIVQFITRSADRDTAPATCDPACEEGSECFLGQCLAPGNECSSFSDCADKEACRNGNCVAVGCLSDNHCAVGEFCSFVSYTCSPRSGGDAGEGVCDPTCPNGYSCETKENVTACFLPPGPGGATSCASSAECLDGLCLGGSCQVVECLWAWDCGANETCENYTCKERPPRQECTSAAQCGPNQECSADGVCFTPDAGQGDVCTRDDDCDNGLICDLLNNQCSIPNPGGDTEVGGDTEPPADDTLDDLDDILDDIDDGNGGGLINDVNDGINNLPPEIKDEVNDSLTGGTIQDKIDSIDAIADETQDPNVLKVLEDTMALLERLQDLRREMDNLRTVMPESVKTIAAWDESSKFLNEAIDAPKNTIKFRRFQDDYFKLKELIRLFPVVQSKIQAVPATGNVPFTVTFNGLNSADPTGGTISSYQWSYLDNQGNLVSLGNAPVVIHEFTEPNTYAVRLQVSTSKKDSQGYKVASDGVSTILVRAQPPASKVDFRINGAEVTDVYHATFEEARAGLSFDPSPTVPALGRLVEKYEWNYGDSKTEERTTPATVIHSYNKPGDYTVVLKTTDNHGITDKKSVTVLVKSLAAEIGIEPPQGDVNTSFRMVGTDSRSDDGYIKEFQWEIRDTENNVVASNQEETFFHSFDRPGEYEITLTVVDVTGAADKTIKVLNVFSRPPSANFTYSIPETNHPNRVEFNAFNSYDPDQGDSITYSWDFDGDGVFDIVESKEIKTVYEYKKRGEYRTKLEVKDLFGKRHQVEKTISINSTLGGDIVLDQKAVQVGEEVIFKATSSGSVAYLWEFGDGQTNSTSQDTVTYTYKTKGKYKVRLHFFDDRDDSNTDAVYVLVGDQEAPIAAASVTVSGRNPVITPDLCGEAKDGIIVSRADNLALSGQNSINRDGSSRLLSYAWKFSNGVQNNQKDFFYRFEEINKADQCFSAGLVVRDQITGMLSSEDVLYFKVINQVPTIVDFAIESGGQTSTPAKIHLRAINPKDPDGAIKKYRWWYYREGYETDKLGVHSTSDPETDMVVTAQGGADVENRYFFVLEITDNDNGVYNSTEMFGETSTLSIVNGPNLSPVAEFTVDKTTVAVGDSISFVSRSYDPQGDALPMGAFLWDFDGDGAFDDSSSGPQVNRQFNTPGEYEVRLKVTHRGLSSSTTKKVYIESTNRLPQAAFTYEVKGNKVTFHGDTSRYDPDLDDTRLRYEWDFDAGKDANGNGLNDDDVESEEVNPVHEYPETGTYRVRLKVKDSLGNEGVVARDLDLNLTAEERDRDTYRSLKVLAPNHPLTSLDIAVSPAVLKKGGTADVSVTVLNADNSPYYGQVFFEVLQGSGDFTPNPVDAKDSRASAVFNASDTGLVRIRVKATGTYYGEVVEEITLNVK